MFGLRLKKSYCVPSSRIFYLCAYTSTRAPWRFRSEKTGRLAVTNNVVGKRSLLQQLAQRERTRTYGTRSSSGCVISSDSYDDGRTGAVIISLESKKKKKIKNSRYTVSTAVAVNHRVEGRCRPDAPWLFVMISL